MAIKYDLRLPSRPRALAIVVSWRRSRSRRGWIVTSTCVSTYLPAAKPCELVRSTCCSENRRSIVKRDLAVGLAAVGRGEPVGELHAHFVLAGAEDLGVLVGDEAAELLHGDFERHGGLERRFDQGPAGPDRNGHHDFFSVTSVIPPPNWTTWLRPWSLACSRARSARRSMVSGVSPV